MAAIYVKCPQCGKRGLSYKSGKWRGRQPKKAIVKMTTEEYSEWLRVHDAGETWDVHCRYCGLKKNIFHRELLALQDADPVFTKKRHERLEKRAQFTSRRLGVPVTVRKKK